MRADAYAQSLLDKNYQLFWNHIKKSYNGKSTKFANSIAGCSGDAAITDMWMTHFNQLYNSVNDSTSKELFYEQVSSVASSANSTFSANDVAEACVKQKTGKSVGHDGVAMEAFIFGGRKLHVHIA